MLQTVEQAHDKAAALGKALYSQLFLWLVAKLNTTISAPQRYSLQQWAVYGVPYSSRGQARRNRLSSELLVVVSLLLLWCLLLL